jgi:hypothetical protein
MIVFDRSEVGRFCAAVRRCFAGRPRGLAPPIHFQQTKDNLTLSAFLEEIAIALRLLAKEGPAARLAVSWAMINALEGNGGGVATLEKGEAGSVRTRRFLLAVAVGLVVGLAEFAGGPTVQILLAAWSAAKDLQHYPDSQRRQGPQRSRLPLWTLSPGLTVPDCWTTSKHLCSSPIVSAEPLTLFPTPRSLS